MIDDILEFNKKFVESKGYEKYTMLSMLACTLVRLAEMDCRVE